MHKAPKPYPEALTPAFRVCAPCPRGAARSPRRRRTGSGGRRGWSWSGACRRSPAAPPPASPSLPPRALSGRGRVNSPRWVAPALPPAPQGRSRASP
eukprot:1195157-Prorocentrum_minimum.AAC.1